MTLFQELKKITVAYVRCISAKRLYLGAYMFCVHPSRLFQTSCTMIVCCKTKNECNKKFEMHRVRILVFDTYQTCPVSLNIHHITEGLIMCYPLSYHPPQPLNLQVVTVDFLLMGHQMHGHTFNIVKENLQGLPHALARVLTQLSSILGRYYMHKLRVELRLNWG